MNDREWLDSLKPGDPVTVDRNGDREYILARVDKVTAKTVTVRSTIYSKRDGSERGAEWTRLMILPPTPERVAVAEERRRRSAALRAINPNGIDWWRLPVDLLESVAAIFANAKEHADAQEGA